ncbi:MAG: OmpA family protein [Gammaproteobacteria bacterium]
MKIKQVTGTLALALFTGLAIGAPMTAVEKDGWYVGVNGGIANSTIDERRITNSLHSNGFTVTGFSRDEKDNGYKLFAGYQFGHFALEGGFFDLGTHSFSAQTLPTGSLNGQLEVRGINLDLVGTMPLTQRVSLFGRLGATHSEADATFAGEGAVNVSDPTFLREATNIKYGVGAQYALTERLRLRLEAERFRVNDAVGNKGDIDLFSLGLVMRFGGSKSTPTTVAEKPAPVVVVVPATEQYCSILDIQFEIGQNEIQLEEQEKLSVVATFLNRYPKTTAVIEGHTDDVGAADVNLRLSQSRADSVVDYLVATHGIDSDRLTAVGYGESRPIADNATQEGQRMNRRIGAVIACASDIAGLEPLPARITMAMQMEFALDSARIDPAYHGELRKVANFLNANPSVTATIEGHAGNSTPSKSMEVSRLRAQNVANYLVTQFGVPRSRLGTEGFGEERRFAYNTTLEGQQENRRVNIILNYAN